MNRTTPMHAAVIPGNFSKGKPEEYDRILNFMVKVHRRWLQKEPRSINTIALAFFPNAGPDALESWLLKELGNALWLAGYLPDHEKSADQEWTWGGDLEGVPN